MSLFINQKAKLQKMENVKEHVQEKCEEYFVRLRSGRKRRKDSGREMACREMFMKFGGF